MLRTSQKWLAAAAVAAISVITIACNDTSSTSPASSTPNFAASDLGAGDHLANFEHIEVCKTGSAADITVNMTQTVAGATSATHSFAGGDCEVMGFFDGNNPADITVSEDLNSIPAGFQFDHLDWTVIHRDPVAAPTTGSSTTNLYSITGADNHIGILVEFFNTAIPTTGDEGCTPGYWKQSQHFDSWFGYTQGQTLESVFDVPDALGLDNTTLLAALSLPGGPGVLGGAQNLMRAAVSALLNSSSPNVDYPRTTAEVIASVNAALASGSRSTMLTLAGQLDADNNLGCPLN